MSDVEDVEGIEVHTRHASRLFLEGYVVGTARRR